MAASIESINYGVTWTNAGITAKESVPGGLPAQEQPQQVPEDTNTMGREAAERTKKAAEERKQDWQENLKKEGGLELAEINRYGIYDGTGQLYVRVLDPRTKEVKDIKPSEHLLELRLRLKLSMSRFVDKTG
jgi:uncharacterized FlaG/YvyC family protein